jgi:hypothetical protein
MHAPANVNPQPTEIQYPNNINNVPTPPQPLETNEPAEPQLVIHQSTYLSEDTDGSMLTEISDMDMDSNLEPTNILVFDPVPLWYGNVVCKKLAQHDHNTP